VTSLLKKQFPVSCMSPQKLLIKYPKLSFPASVLLMNNVSVIKIPARLFSISPDAASFLTPTTLFRKIQPWIVMVRNILCDLRVLSFLASLVELTPSRITSASLRVLAGSTGSCTYTAASIEFS